MHQLIKIHRNLFTHVKNSTHYNINHINIKKTDSYTEILNKIDKLSLVINHPHPVQIKLDEIISLLYCLLIIDFVAIVVFYNLKKLIKEINSL